jgi:hypothetical protein
MNIEKEIYKVLIANSGGKQDDILGIAQPTLRTLKKGTGKTAIYNVFDSLFCNGIKSIELSTDFGSLKLDSEKREVFAKVRKKKQ